MGLGHVLNLGGRHLFVRVALHPTLQLSGRAVRASYLRLNVSQQWEY